VGESEDRAKWNGARFVEGDGRGHYESWFQRANHPDRPLGFWIRYTIFAPKGRPDAAIGELWAVFFDGERRHITTVKEEHPIASCRFSARMLDVTIASSRLDRERLEGNASRGGHTIRWSLAYRSPEPPLLLLPERLYEAPVPRAKSVVGSPNARFEGTIEVDGERVVIDGWIGSQNHNWGSRHTDRYAWGQVAGFDDAPDAFLEVATARVRIGPLWTPPLTPIVLRLGGREHRLHALAQAVRARARYEPFQWTFESADREVRIAGTIAAAASSFVALPYRNPPGGIKTCLNTKIARCDLTVERRGERRRTLSAASRAAFEILSDEPPPDTVTVLR
jgi:hypothetical protein